MSIPDPGGQIKPFAAALQEIDSGAASARVSRLLNALVLAVADTRRKGTLTLTITVEPYKKGNGSILDVTARSVLKAPEGDDATASAVFFHNDGNLCRDDPNQPTLPLRKAS